jgi:hypothetical protein
MTYKTYIKYLIFLALVGTLAFLLAQKINLATADLGRHIKNGEILWNSIGNGFWHNSILHTNTYSYTNPDFSVPNHHWASGILFYLIYAAVGFSGLQIFYIALLLAALGLVFLVSVKAVGFKATLLTSLLVIPLIAYRNEVRPEGLSYLFSAVFIAVLFYWNQKHKSRIVWLLLLVQLLWVNSHIYFFLGPAIVSTFLLDVLIRKSRKTVTVAWLLVGTVVASLINPFFIKGVIYPFTIFSNYGYRVLENQTVWFLQKLHIYNPTYVLFEVVAVVCVVILAYAGIQLAYKRVLGVGWWPTMDSRLRGNDKRKNMNAEKGSGDDRKSALPLWIVFLALGGLVMGLFAVRNFAVFGLFTLPLLSYGFAQLFLSRFTWLKTPPVYASVVLLILCSQFFLFYNTESSKNPSRGVGLLPHSLDAAQFLKTHNIQGPIFNNYDIGGYLIFSLYPEQRVFVDNRPESYPKTFFQDVYIPAQEQNSVWLKQLEHYKFNTIVYYYRDATPWAQTFLISRLHDSDWTPVFVDSTILIFLRRTPENMVIIDKYQIPASYFSFR